MSQPSGKFVLRVPPEMHLSLKAEAKSHDLSLNEWIVQKLAGRQGPSPAPLISPLSDHFGQDLIGVIQFGSSVRGEMRTGSDVDLLIVLADSRQIDRSLYLAWDQLFPGSQYSIFSPQFSQLPKARQYSSLWLEVSLEGQILHDPSGRLAAELRRIRERIAAGEYCRKMSHGQPYWVRKDNVNAK